MSKNFSSDKKFIYQHLTQITPSFWVTDIYLVAYPLLLIWFLYMFYLIGCRQFCKKHTATTFSSEFWTLLVVFLILDSLIVYFYTDNVVLSSVLIIIQTAMLYFLTWMAFDVCWNHISDHDDNCTENSENNDVVELNRCEIILLRILTLNVFPLFAIFNTVVLVWQWAIIVEYRIFNWSDNLTCLVMLSILAVVLIIYWHMDLLFLRNYFVWTWLPSFAVIISFIGVFQYQDQIGSKQKPALLFAFVIFIVSIVQLFLKTIFLCLCPSSRSNKFSRV